MTPPHRTIGDALETDYTEDDVERAYHAPIVDDDETPSTYSAALLRQYNRAKRASKKNDERSKNIVKQLTKERKKMNKKTKTPTKERKQKTISDFGGN